MCLIDRIQKPALYFVDYSFMIGGIIIQGHVYAKYNVSISSRTIVSGYTNYKSNNPVTHIISMVNGIMNVNAYYELALK